MSFGESTMSRTQVQLWYNRFKEGREDVNDDVRPDRRITITEVADDDGISFGLCQAIFTDILGMKFAAVQIVPKLPNF